MRTEARWRLVRILATAIVLFCFWILFSGRVSLGIAASGLVCALVIAASAYDVFIERHEAGRRAVFPRFLPTAAFPFVLIRSMYASSFRVLRIVLTGKATPRVVHFRSHLRSDLARVALAEAITFTPGTIALELDEDHLVVHWLNATTRHSARAGAEVKGSLEDHIGRMWS